LALFQLSDCRHVAGGFSESLDHPECLAFDDQGRIFAGGEAGQIFRITGGVIEEYANTGGGVGGIALDADGNLYECNYGTAVVNRVTPDGQVTVYSRGSMEVPAVLPNFPVFDEVGNLYYSDSGEWDKANGRIYVVRPDTRTELLVPNYLHFPNGMALDSSGRWLYVIQSTASNVIRFPIEDNRLGDPEIVLTLPTGTIPDGLAFSEVGNLYIACFDPDVIYVQRPDGALDVVVQGCNPNILCGPANAAFCDDDDSLYYSNHKGWSIASVPVGEKGMSLRYPSLVAASASTEQEV
jgi:gluconolactonase